MRTIEVHFNHEADDVMSSFGVDTKQMSLKLKTAMFESILSLFEEQEEREVTNTPAGQLMALNLPKKSKIIERVFRKMDTDAEVVIAAYFFDEVLERTLSLVKSILNTTSLVLHLDKRIENPDTEETNVQPAELFKKIREDFREMVKRRGDE